ncbi:glycerate kinase [Algoriphagus halophytocola]|uniref:glycerate kinase family protein n=1 Tax=Algoriphagus halophytocola TaxID=2991499 RepID=UPI0022DD23F9|nr:glycerate kinase [Algoriphagus sp. TR-M9]WBL44692.1 glycerate kinase [Algoriphagus sp. TR-M9]
MHVLVAPNAFKGTLSAQEVAGIIEHCLKAVKPTYFTQSLPVADGGDGTCELLTEIGGYQKKETWTLDALGRPIAGQFGWDHESLTAYIDVSTASGVGNLLPEEKDPQIASTFGTGILISEAIDLGAKHIVLGLGGSATIDLGLGILAALGLEFLDEKGRALALFSPGFTKRIKHIQLKPNLPKIKFSCLCDVSNTFFGPKGAVPVFGQQKGLNPDLFEEYEKQCQQIAHKLYAKSGKSFTDQDGFGAAGGIALGLSAFFDARIEFGAQYFFQKTGLEDAVKKADWVITGEGRYDSQSEAGKASHELLQIVRRQEKKIALITSGDEGRDVFDQHWKLKDLDFSQENYLQEARTNLRNLVMEKIRDL